MAANCWAVVEPSPELGSVLSQVACTGPGTEPSGRAAGRTRTRGTDARHRRTRLGPALPPDRVAADAEGSKADVHVRLHAVCGLHTPRGCSQAARPPSGEAATWAWQPAGLPSDTCTPCLTPTKRLSMSLPRFGAVRPPPLWAVTGSCPLVDDSQLPHRRFLGLDQPTDSPRLGGGGDAGRMRQCGLPGTSSTNWTVPG